MQDQDALENDGTKLTNAVRLVGESVLPGASLLMDGKLANGAAHALVGFGARALAGPAGIVLVAADSYSKSVSGKYLWDHVGPLLNRQKDDVDAAEMDVQTEDAPSSTASTKKV